MKLAGFDFDLMDIDTHRYPPEQIENILKQKKYDIVCFGCIVTGYRIAKNLCELIRKIHPKAKIIVGNSVGSSISEILLERTEVDIAVLGEGDITIVNLLKTLEKDGSLAEVNGICYKHNGHYFRTQDRPLIKNLDLLPWIDFSIFDIEIYIENSKSQVNDPFPIPPEKVRALPVNSTRGCMYKCTFCYNTFQNKRYRTRSPQSVVAEVTHFIDKYELNTVYFSDELTFFSKKQSLKFVETILKSGIKFYWAGNCRSDLFNQEKDLYLIQKFKQVGCFGFNYALESADPEILKAMN